MKIIAITAAAVLAASTAFAQTAGTAATAGATPGTSPSTMTPGGTAGDSMSSRTPMGQPGDTMTDRAGSATPGASPAAPGSYTNSGNGSMAASNDTALTQRGGVWYNGDRRATKDEVAQYKAAKKNRPS
jgi:hypothetical protein